MLNVVLIVFFAYFYTSMVFNPDDTADNLKKQGGFIPGVRPGRATAAYIKNALNKITLPSAVFLALIAIVPSIIFSFTGNQLIQAFGGTSILIMVASCSTRSISSKARSRCMITMDSLNRLEEDCS